MKYQNYGLNPKCFPLGLNNGWLEASLEKKQETYNFWIPTIHNVEWCISVDTRKSEETNNVQFSIYQKNQPSDPFHSIELDVGIVVENLESSEYSIHSEGSYEFVGNKNDMIIEIPGYDKIIDRDQKYFDNKKEQKTFKICYLIVVKSMRMCDSVQMLDFFKMDPSMFDVEVNVLGHTMFLSKKLISLQSPKLANLVETGKISTLDISANVPFLVFHDFLQVVHGVDLKLNRTNTSHFLSFAKLLEVPRVTEYCKQQMVIGCCGMSTNEIIELAEKESFWDMVPRKLNYAKSLHDLKAQQWDLEKLDDKIIEEITSRMFELK